MGYNPVLLCFAAQILPALALGNSLSGSPGVNFGSAFVKLGFPGCSFGKKSASAVGDPDSLPESGKYPGEGNGNPLQCSYLENSIDRGAWGSIVHGVPKSLIQLSD